MRWWAIRRGFPSDGSVTVCIATWNSAEHLAVALSALRLHSNRVDRIIVVDNWSEDATRQVATRDPRVQLIRLPFNAGHGTALNIAVIAARTEFVVTLDPDAFPIDDEWVSTLVQPLAEGARVSGVVAYREFAHPCCLAIRTERFIQQRHSFSAKGKVSEYGTSGWDTGESISMLERPDVRLFPATSTLGPGMVGTAWEGIAYHNFYSVRHRRGVGSGPVEVLDGGITTADSASAWDQSCRKYLGLTEEDRCLLVSAQ